MLKHESFAIFFFLLVCFIVFLSHQCTVHTASENKGLVKVNIPKYRDALNVLCFATLFSSGKKGKRKKLIKLNYLFMLHFNFMLLLISIYWRFLSVAVCNLMSYTYSYRTLHARKLKCINTTLPLTLTPLASISRNKCENDRQKREN